MGTLYHTSGMLMTRSTLPCLMYSTTSGRGLTSRAGVLLDPLQSGGFASVFVSTYESKTQKTKRKRRRLHHVHLSDRRVDRQNTHTHSNAQNFAACSYCTNQQQIIKKHEHTHARAKFRRVFVLTDEPLFIISNQDAHTVFPLSCSPTTQH